MPAKSKKADDRSLEEILDEVEIIMEKMESDKPSLEESFVLYEQGIKALKTATQKIDMVEKKLEILRSENDGD